MIKSVSQYRAKALQKAINVDSSNMKIASVIIKETLSKREAKKNE
jgi:hypothetical protein